jgi:hypothetical protein
VQAVTRKRALLGLVLSLWPGLLMPAVPASAQSLDAQRFASVLEAARGYAADQDIIFYCLRYTKEQKPYLFAVLHGQIQDARVKLKAAGADNAQEAELVRTVLANVHFYPADASNASLDKRCTTEEVEKNYAQLGAVSFSLVQRPAFRAAVP